MNQKNKLVIGYIGNGKSTNRYHLTFVMSRSDKILVKTIYRRNPSHDSWEKYDDINYTTNINSLLNDPDIQMICVTTNANHYDLAKKVLEHGKHCLVEKPFTDTYEHALELFQLAKEKGLLLECYQNRRYDSDFLTVQKVINSGKLGDLLELEMHFDYYRPEVPMNTPYSQNNSYLYGHGSHTLDQVISYFGKPDSIHYDVRQLSGHSQMNDYYDLDLYYGITKVSIRSSYYRIKPRASFIVYGKKGMFVKEQKDKQETHLKMFYLPGNGHADFGVDNPEEYGVLTYYDNQHQFHEEKVPSEIGDYGRVYDALYDTIINGEPQIVQPEQTLLIMRIMENGINHIH